MKDRSAYGRTGRRKLSRAVRLAAVGGAMALAGGSVLLSSVQPAYAIGTAVGLGDAEAYSVLGGQSVTNTGPSVLDGDLGVSPGSSITGFPPGIVLGVTHGGDAQALGAQADLTVAYDDAAGQASDAVLADELGGITLPAGVFTAPSSLGLTGTLTLDAEGDPDAVFIIQVGSALTTASSSTIALVNGARACNVFWQVGSSATLGADTTFIGTLMALTSISANTGSSIEGRLLARNGSVTLDSNAFTLPICDDSPGDTTTTDADSSTTTTEVDATTTTDVGSSTTTTEVEATTTSDVGSSTTTEVDATTTSDVGSSTTTEVDATTTSDVGSSTTTTEVDATTTSDVGSSTTTAGAGSSTTGPSSSTEAGTPTPTPGRPGGPRGGGSGGAMAINHLPRSGAASGLLATVGFLTLLSGIVLIAFGARSSNLEKR